MLVCGRVEFAEWSDSSNTLAAEQQSLANCQNLITVISFLYVWACNIGNEAGLKLVICMLRAASHSNTFYDFNLDHQVGDLAGDWSCLPCRLQKKSEFDLQE